MKDENDDNAINDTVLDAMNTPVAKRSKVGLTIKITKTPKNYTGKQRVINKIARIKDELEARGLLLVVLNDSGEEVLVYEDECTIEQDENV